MGSAVELTSENFHSTVATGVALVDFWSEGCAPCLMLAPFIDQLAEEYAGRATVGKIEIFSALDIADELGVSTVPTLIIMKDGAEVTRYVGATSKPHLTKALDDALA